MRPPADRFRFHPYQRPAAGWGALRSVAHAWRDSKQPFKNLRAMLQTNQHGGFDCPSCAWGEAPKEGRIRFCENGAKAVNWEATGRGVDAAFFRENSIDQLLKHDDYWLEYQGRLTEPMYLDGSGNHYRPIGWDEAFAVIARHLKGLASPDEAAFYTSGRASNEAAFLYQLFARAYGTNNLPDCSNMCHEASGVALQESIGTGKGTVTYEDFARADAIFLMGQNPGTNHPRMLEPLREAVARGAQVVVFNPLRERGLERFQSPQNALQMLTDGDSAMNTAYFRPALGGDMAAVRGIAKFIFQWQREAEQDGAQGPLDLEFVAAHCAGFEAYRQVVDQTSWGQILAQSGLQRAELERAAHIFARSERLIFCWAMGITQHRHSVPTIQEITNLLLLRGQIGKPGAGLCPVRGHSNVQGDRTMGIADRPAPELLDALEQRFGFSCPREDGVNVVKTIEAMEEGRIRVFVGLGGNFAQATPDTPRTHRALQRCQLTVQISTKLNRSHLVTGREALILPCLGRTDIDRQLSGPQAVTVEDSFSMVHASFGQLQPLSSQMRSEPAIIAGIADATLGKDMVNWLALVEDYGRIRDLIADVIPGFRDFNRRLEQPGGFYLQNPAGQRRWNTDLGKAKFITHSLPDSLLNEGVRHKARKPDLVLQTLRSHDQFNTTVYSLNDRYRGVKGERHVLFANLEDIHRLGFEDRQKVDIVSLWNDDIERRVQGFTLIAFDIPEGQAATYYPEANPLVPLESYGIGSYTPTSKFIAIRLEQSTAPERIV
ncbi:oxidoreductase alpha (molybdopterin) subunit [Microbulbifer donghaiensis]|uniref:Oxidoreductase alpha (Molybdopterin) subunit n=1 Tax=Microbulbifer donghaiensis TaxID=494016 RepID=A0A1M4V3A5_9GAMM|nr:FdhF/YdeP family oxidoreductase [Microbulbifer donghaiensis]SHE63474.1 oxidoreductase alpha (molybdopterin) subunit [Microbulbifer donghaiensis]